MDKRLIRDAIKMLGAIAFIWLYIPHIILYVIQWKKCIVDSDIEAVKHQTSLKMPIFLHFLSLLHNSSYFRSLYYYRIGPEASLLIGWWRPGEKTFILPYSTKIGKNFRFAHPYSTVLNADSIGDNFSCIHCTTLGKKDNKRPVIGDNVTIGCHVCIIGGVHIGNNVTIGAGSVVVKDVPDNAIVVGNPQRIIGYRDNKECIYEDFGSGI